jgi:integrase
LKQALRWQLIARNPVEAVDKLKDSPKAMTLWTAAQAVHFLETARTDRLYAAFHLLLVTGMRRGEVLGLQWDDIRGDVLYVRRSYTVSNGKPLMSTPKTEKGIRRVILSDDTLHVLRLHQERQAAEKAYCEGIGLRWDGGMVFTTEIGTPIHPRNFQRTWDKLQEVAGVPHIRLHDARHLHASLLIRQGFDPRAVADRLGHSDPSFTLRTYSHAFEERRQAMAIGLSDLLGTDREVN